MTEGLLAVDRIRSRVVVTGIGRAMTHDPSEPDVGPTAPAAEAPARRPRGPDPLSAAHRRRMLAALNRAAADGDIGAQQALIELSLAAERDAEIADTLRRLRAEGEGEG